MSSETLKAELMHQMEGIVDEMLKEQDNPNPLTLSDIERLAIKAGQDFRERVLEGLAKLDIQQREAEGVQCCTCGGKVRYKGKKGKQVITEAGELYLERDYYYCEACRDGFFPSG